MMRYTDRFPAKAGIQFRRCGWAPAFAGEQGNMA